MLRRAIIAAAGRALRGRLFFTITQAFFLRHLPILFYHGLWPASSLSKRLFWGHSIDAFRSDMLQLSARFRFIELEAMLDLNDAEAKPDRPVMAICFDDGHAMFRSGAVALLEELGIKATIFVVTDCIGNKKLMWTHALNAVAQLRGTERLMREIQEVIKRHNLELTIPFASSLGLSLRNWPMDAKEEIIAEIFEASNMPSISEFLDEHRPYADWDELQDWIDYGHSVGLHTRTHPFCSEMSLEAIESEIISPAHELRSRLGIAKLAFAYPFGDRLPTPEIEQRICEKAELSCMLGVAGLSPLGTRRWQLDRVDAERGITTQLFGRPMVRAAIARTYL
jgi:peptidoglycan/xylan/chitin deacetylase (PgdA/CDA1 family)